MTWDRFFTFGILIWVFIYTLSYGAWNWKNKNRLGAIVVIFLAVASVALPIYSLYFRQG